MDNNPAFVPFGGNPLSDAPRASLGTPAGQGSFELVFVNSIIGFRVWFFEELHRMLRSPVYAGDWSYRRWVTAKCGCFQRPCHCGISAFIRPEEAVEYGERMKGRGTRVLGAVQGMRGLSREVFRKGNGEETVGWRSEQQRLLALISQEEGLKRWASKDVLESVAWAWSVPVIKRQGVEVFLDRRFGGT
jgi:hypothetical protein